MKARAIVITSYIEYPVDIGSLLRDGDRIVCLDGGFDEAVKQGIRTDILLGDMDSLEADIESMTADPNSLTTDLKILRYPPEKDYTDLELAFIELDPAETPEVLVIGAMGGRLDMTAVNIQLLERYSSRFEKIEMIDGRNRCFVLHGGSEVRLPKTDSYLSLIPLTDTCEGVSLTGAKYPLEKATLHRGASLGVSNEFADDEVMLSLEQGSLLVVITTH